MSTSSFKVVLAEISRNLAATGGEGRRLFHGRGGCFQGFQHLNIDFFPPVLVIQTYRQETETTVGALLAALSGLLPNTGSEAVTCYLVQERFRDEGTWRLLAGRLPEQLFLRENGMVFELTVMKNRNTGLFLDMRLGRELVKGLAHGRKVLNLFAYTCAFSVAALSGGADAVVNLDVSRPALHRGRANHEHNHHDPRNVSFLALDVMKSFGRLRRLGPFSMIVIDPPTRQHGRFDARRDYAKLLRRLPEWTEAGAEVIACLNAPSLDNDFLAGLFDARFQPMGQYGRPPEYPEQDPQQSLKIHHYRFS